MRLCNGGGYFRALDLPLNEILVACQGAGTASAHAGLDLRPGSDTGILLGVGKELAVGLGGGTQAGPADALLVGAGIFGFDPEAPALLAAPQQIPYPVAAAAVLERFVKAGSRGRAERAAAAPTNLGCVWLSHTTASGRGATLSAGKRSAFGP